MHTATLHHLEEGPEQIPRAIQVMMIRLALRDESEESESVWGRWRWDRENGEITIQKPYSDMQIFKMSPLPNLVELIY